MKLTQPDLKTLESYKKATKSSATQIKDKTKFCIYNEVQIPDAHGKLHVLKPFLVVGHDQSSFKPLLPLLKGAKKFLAEGTCAVEEGKVILYGSKVPFSQMKSQASLFRDLLGKPIGMPSGAKDEDEDKEEEAEAKREPSMQPALGNVGAALPKPPIVAPPPPNIAGPAGKPSVPPVSAAKPSAPLGPPPPRPNTAGPAKPSAPPTPPAPAAHQEPHPVRLAKASTAWHGTRGVVNGKCNELKQAIRSHYGKSHPAVIKEIESSMHKIDAIVMTLDHKLTVSLKKASDAPTELVRQAELRVARGILNQYMRYVQTEPLIAHIDRNPFGVQCNLRQVLASSLTHMSQSLVA